REGSTPDPAGERVTWATWCTGDAGLSRLRKQRSLWSLRQRLIASAAHCVSGAGRGRGAGPARAGRRTRDLSGARPPGLRTSPRWDHGAPAARRAGRRAQDGQPPRGRGGGRSGTMTTSTPGGRPTTVADDTIDVLVVDDDFRVARVHRAYVARVEPFRVTGVAGTGEEAVAAVGELRPDLVLLDLYLPDLFGLDVIPRLRAAGH